MSKWSIDEFVDILNQNVPLNGFDTDSDKRRSTIWTKRMVRSYFSNSDLAPSIRVGKQKLYNEEHLEDFRKLILLQYSGVPYKTATSVLKSSYEDASLVESSVSGLIDNNSLARGFTASANNSFSESNMNDLITHSGNMKRNNALEILQSFGNKKNISDKSHNKMWLKETISEGVELNIREDILKNKSFINSLKKWLEQQENK